MLPAAMPSVCRHCESIRFDPKTYASVLVAGGDDGLRRTLEEVEARIVPCVTAVCPKCERVSVLSDGSTRSVLGTIRTWRMFREWIDGGSGQ